MPSSARRCAARSARLQQRLGITMLYVTHDQVEAMTMADQVILMRGGRIEQNGAPADLYERPATMFAARFVGTPPMNVLISTTARSGAVIARHGGPALFAARDTRPRARRAAGRRACGVNAGSRFSDCHGGRISRRRHCSSRCRIGERPILARTPAATALRRSAPRSASSGTTRPRTCSMPRAAVRLDR